MSTPLPRRDEIPAKGKWNLESVFPTLEAWEAEFARVESLLPGLAHFQGRLGESAAVLTEALTQESELGVAFDKVYLYAGMAAAGDSGDQAAAALNSRAGGLYARRAAAAAFYEPEMLKLAPETLAGWLTQEPKLAIYKHYFDTLARRRAHVRSEEVEILLAEVSEPLATPGAAASVLEDADLTFKPVTGTDGAALEVAQGTISDLVRDASQAVRRAAWESYADGYLGVKNTMAVCLSGQVKKTVFRARTRAYPSALEASLSPKAIPLEVFETLLTTFQANLPIWHRYWDILRRGLGVKRLHNADVPVYAVPAPLPRTEKAISFAEATEMICRGMAPLGKEYTEAMRRGLTEQRWVDALPNKGKGSGAGTA